MKKMALGLAMVFLFSVVLAGKVFAQDKFAYIDLKKTFSEYNKTKSYDAILGEKEKSIKTEFDKKLGSLKKLEEELNLLNDKEKQAKKPDYDAKVNDLKEFDQQKATDLRKERDEKIQEILKDIEAAVNQYSIKQGYTFVFNDMVLVYKTKSVDITDDIIKILNSGYKK